MKKNSKKKNTDGSAGEQSTSPARSDADLNAEGPATNRSPNKPLMRKGDLRGHTADERAGDDFSELPKASVTPAGQATNVSRKHPGKRARSGQTAGNTFIEANVASNKIGSAELGAAAVADASQRSPGLPEVVSQRDTTHLSYQVDAKGLGVAMIKFRTYQMPVFIDRTSGILILHWSRQIGKSFTLAGWAVDRLLSQLQKYDTWLITVLSNSRDNGAEFNLKCSEICRKMEVAFVSEDSSPDIKYENMRMETRITLTVNGRERIGRIKVLAANPRTARGFSGDLILDEFAHHEDSVAIWEAAEPILSSNPEFLCRIAATGNGKHNMFYQMVSGGDARSDGVPYMSAAGYLVCRVTRTEAHRMGVKVYDPNTRKPITPAEARAKSMDKRAYDQNYECAFNDENMQLLTHGLISDAERMGIVIDEQTWSVASIVRMFRAEGELYVGNDIGRNRDLSVVTVLEKVGQLKRVIGMLRMSGMRGPEQRKQLEVVCRLPKFRAYEGDMTGMGVFFVEELQEVFGTHRIRGVNFATTETLVDSRAAEAIKASGRKAESARVTELMATELLLTFEERAIEIPTDPDLRADLAKPEKITSPGGRVSIAATRDEAGHADHFWSLALALRAAANASEAGRIIPPSGQRARVIAERRERTVIA